MCLKTKVGPSSDPTGLGHLFQLPTRHVLRAMPTQAPQRLVLDSGRPGLQRELSRQLLAEQSSDTAPHSRSAPSSLAWLRLLKEKNGVPWIELQGLGRGLGCESLGWRRPLEAPQPGLAPLPKVLGVMLIWSLGPSGLGSWKDVSYSGNGAVHSLLPRALHGK